MFILFIIYISVYNIDMMLKKKKFKWCKILLGIRNVYVLFLIFILEINSNIKKFIF